MDMHVRYEYTLLIKSQILYFVPHLRLANGDYYVIYIEINH